nr:hypothetical protein BaRGS_020215 [Batillaria attramentaria]
MDVFLEHLLRDCHPLLLQEPEELGTINRGVLPLSWKPAQSPAVAIVLLDAGVYESLAWSSPDTFAAITVRQSEARFVCEEYHAPLMSIPTLLVAAERHAGTAMTWCKGQTDDSFP